MHLARRRRAVARQTCPASSQRGGSRPADRRSLARSDGTRSGDAVHDDHAIAIGGVAVAPTGGSDDCCWANSAARVDFADCASRDRLGSRRGGCLLTAQGHESQRPAVRCRDYYRVASRSDAAASTTGRARFGLRGIDFCAVCRMQQSGAHDQGAAPRSQQQSEEHRTRSLVRIEVGRAPACRVAAYSAIGKHPADCWLSRASKQPAGRAPAGSSLGRRAPGTTSGGLVGMVDERG